MVGDVLEKTPLGLDFTGDAGNMWPQVAGILLSPLASGDAERLAGVSGSDAINFSTPWLAVKGSNVRPDRRRIQPSCFHMRNKEAGNIGFPLDITNGTGIRHGETQAKLKPASAGT